MYVSLTCELQLYSARLILLHDYQQAYQCEMCSFHTGTAEDLSLPGCYTVSPGKMKMKTPKSLSSLNIYQHIQQHPKMLGT